MTYLRPIMLGLAILGFAPAPALATEAGAAAEEAAAPERIEIDLNRLEPADSACRFYMVFANTTPRSYASLKLDLVMFDASGVILKRLAVDGAPLPAGKTRLEVFDAAGLRCEEIAHVLFNDVLACDGNGGAAFDDCLGLIETKARGTVPFIK